MGWSDYAWMFLVFTYCALAGAAGTALAERYTIRRAKPGES